MTFEGVSQYRGVPRQAPSPLHYAAALPPFCPPSPGSFLASALEPQPHQPQHGSEPSGASPPRTAVPWGAATGAVSLDEAQNCSPEFTQLPAHSMAKPDRGRLHPVLSMGWVPHALGSLARGASQPGDGKLAARPWCMLLMLITVYVPISLPA